MKKKRFFSVLIWMSMAAAACAVEVISIDINGYGNNTAYTGEAAVPGATNWVAYSGGWGIPAGSPRSADLDKDGTIKASTYARQVWVGDVGNNHTFAYGTGTGLMDDGFVKSAGAPADPNLYLYGRDAYGGAFNLYVYGQGNFTVVAGNFNQTKTVTGGVPSGQFIENGNYAVFSNVQIGDPNGCRIYYSNTLNGIQLVSLKQPKAVIASTDPNDNAINARQYDVARDTNNRSGEWAHYGPDLGTYVHYIDQGEFMAYDITVGSGQEAAYSLAAKVITQYGAANLTMYLDGKAIPGGTLTCAVIGNGTINLTNAVTINLLEGSHTIKWATETGNIFFDMVGLNLVYAGPISITSCEDVYFYGLNFDGDINKDCRVNLSDLVAMAADWTKSNNPK